MKLTKSLVSAAELDFSSVVLVIRSGFSRLELKIEANSLDLELERSQRAQRK
jgi:hypothetical protein